MMMEHSKDLLDKISTLSVEQQNIMIKLLDYIATSQYSKSQTQNLIRDDIREVILEENQNDSK